MRTFVKVRWYNDVGIVKVYDTVTKEYLYLIGRGLGLDEQTDIQYIMDWGYKFNFNDIK